MTVLMEQNGAQLVRQPDGTVVCRCPFACAATYEPCEFARLSGAHHAEHDRHIGPNGFLP